MPLAICTGPVHRFVFAYSYGIKSPLEICMKFLSFLNFLSCSTNVHESVSFLNF